MLIMLSSVGVAVLLVAGGDTTDQTPGGDLLPTVELTSSEGGRVSTDSFRDSPMVINFWFSTCAPCATELRDFAAVHEIYGEQVRFVGVNPLDSVDRMVEFAGERGVSYELFLDHLAELQTELRLTSFPVTLFVTSDGHIVDQAGVLDEASLSTRIDGLLAADQR